MSHMVHTCQILVDVIDQCGQRAFVGKVSMDRNSPPFYIESTSLGVAAAESFYRSVLARTEGDLSARRIILDTN